MPRPTLDVESYSEAGYVWTEPTDKHPLGRYVPPKGAKTMGISAVGSAAYAEHPSTEVLCASYDLADGLGVRRWLPGQPMPLDLRLHLDADGTLEFHKADFEVGMWAEQLVKKHGWSPLPAGAARCSMAKAHVAQYPGALGNLGAVLGIETEKDKDGKRLINKFCVPQQPIPGLVDKRTGRVKREPVPARRIYPHDDPEDFERLCAYCDTDVVAQMQASDAMPDMEPAELAFWQLDQEMNHYGMGVDRTGLHACIVILEQVIEQYGLECQRLTGFAVTQLEKLKGWLAAHGVYTESLDAENMDVLLARNDLPPLARRVLELRALTGSASVKKTFAIQNYASDDDRLRHTVIHHGTRTGRPSGADVQPLNLPKAGPQLVICDCGKPHMPTLAVCPWCGEIGTPNRRASWRPEMVDPVLEIMSLGVLSVVEAYFGDAMLCISGCLRGLFVASEGNVLVASDYSAIEAVVAAELAGEQWRIEAFQRNEPIYLVGAAKITGKTLQFYLDWKEQHGDHHPDRQYIGKVSELACAYGGYIGSYKAFGSTEPDDVIKKQVLAWRGASPMIVEAWGGQWRGPPWRRERHELYGYEGMFIAAVQNPGQTFAYRGIRFCVEEADCLVVRLLSGRPLRYREPMLTVSDRNRDELSITYMTWNTNTAYGPRGWTRMSTYGGRLFENITQATACDIMRNAQTIGRSMGYQTILAVYDEMVVEAKKGSLTVEQLESIMMTLPDWAVNWPIRAAGGWENVRYRKG